jgi:cytochrome c peroxidase
MVTLNGSDARVQNRGLMPPHHRRLRNRLGVPAIASLAVLLHVYALAEDLSSAAAGSNDRKFELDLPLGLPPGEFSVPANNPMGMDKIALGRTLFFDVRLSFDDSVACASCHVPQHAFTDARRTARGIDSQTGPRNTPTIINRAFSSAQFLDGRAPSLEDQVTGPLTNPIEMGMPGPEPVVEKVAAIAGYEAWFRRIFGRGVHIDDIAKAIAAFERTLVSGGSRADRFFAGDQDAINESEKRGFAIFNGKARCSQCHSGPLFTDEKYHNIGIGWDGDQVDLGRYRVTGRSEDIGAFKTPTLREIGLTSPYMHNGAFSTLEETIEFYDNGGISNPFLDIEMKRPTRTLEQLLAHYEKDETERTGPDPGSEPAKLNLTGQERTDLAAFLRTLGGVGWRDIGPPDAFPE